MHLLYIFIILTVQRGLPTYCLLFVFSAFHHCRSSEAAVGVPKQRAVERGHFRPLQDFVARLDDQVADASQGRRSHSLLHRRFTR